MAGLQLAEGTLQRDAPTKTSGTRRVTLQPNSGHFEDKFHGSREVPGVRSDVVVARLQLGAGFPSNTGMSCQLFVSGADELTSRLLPLGFFQSGGRAFCLAQRLTEFGEHVGTPGKTLECLFGFIYLACFWHGLAQRL